MKNTNKLNELIERRRLYELEKTLDIASESEVIEVEPKEEAIKINPNAKRYYVPATNEYINII